MSEQLKHSAYCNGQCGKRGVSSDPGDYCPEARKGLGSPEQRRTPDSSVSEAGGATLTEVVRKFVEKHGRNGSKTGRADYARMVGLDEIEALRVALARTPDSSVSEADTRRLDWLEQKALYDVVDCGAEEVWQLQFATPRDNDNELMRKAIDAAMSVSMPPQSESTRDVLSARRQARIAECHDEFHYRLEDGARVQPMCGFCGESWKIHRPPQSGSGQ